MKKKITTKQNTDFQLVQREIIIKTPTTFCVQKITERVKVRAKK